MKHAACVLIALCCVSSAASAFDGNYTSQGRTLKIIKQGEAYKVDLNASGSGCIASHIAPGSIRGDILISSQGKGPSACMLQMRPSATGLTVSESAGCADYRGMRCQEFAGSYARSGGARSQQSASGSGKSGWVLEKSRDRSVAVARNGTGSMAMVIRCSGPAGKRVLSLATQGVPKGFKPFQASELAQIRVGQTQMDFVLEGDRQQSALSVVPFSRDNDAALIAALGAGGVITMSGKPFAGVSTADRTFNASGGAAPTAAVLASCN